MCAIPGPISANAVLVTRPQPAAAATAARLTAMGFVPVLAPLLDIAPIAAVLPPAASVQAVLAASANAVAGLPAAYRTVPLLAVGAATAARAAAAGFTRVHHADGDAAALARLAGRLCQQAAGPLVLAAGAGQGGGLLKLLRAAGFSASRVTVYAARPATALPPAARAALQAGGLRAALFFSAETAQCCVRLIAQAGLAHSVAPIAALAIGPAAALRLAPLPWRSIRVAARPNQDELLALLQ